MSPREAPRGRGPRPLWAARMALSCGYRRAIVDFDPRAWLGMAVIAWLCTVGGGGARLQLPLTGPTRVALPVMDARWSDAWSWLALGYLLLVVIGGFVLGVWLLTTWLNCRAAFVFVDAVAGGHARIGGAWRRAAAPGRALFRFRLGMALLLGGWISALLFVMGLFLAIGGLLDGGYGWSGPATLGMVLGGGGGALGGAALYRGVLALVDDLVVPLMYARRCGLARAGGELVRWIRRWPRAFAGYALVRVGIGGLGAVLFALVGLGCGLGRVPMLDALLLWPVLLVSRAVGLVFLSDLEGLGELRRW